jgi:hypothetical protein
MIVDMLSLGVSASLMFWAKNLKVGRGMERGGWASCSHELFCQATHKMAN